MREFNDTHHCDCSLPRNCLFCDTSATTATTTRVSHNCRSKCPCPRSYVLVMLSSSFSVGCPGWRNNRFSVPFRGSEDEGVGGMILRLYDGRPEVSRALKLGGNGVTVEVKVLVQEGLTCAAVAGRAVQLLKRGQDPCERACLFHAPSAARCQRSAGAKSQHGVPSLGKSLRYLRRPIWGCKSAAANAVSLLHPASQP